MQARSPRDQAPKKIKVHLKGRIAGDCKQPPSSSTTTTEAAAAAAAYQALLYLQGVVRSSACAAAGALPDAAADVDAIESAAAAAAEQFISYSLRWDVGVRITFYIYTYSSKQYYTDADINNSDEVNQ